MLFVLLTQVVLFLSVPDGVLNGVMPPAGNFLCEQKVTISAPRASLRSVALRNTSLRLGENSLRTNGSKNSFVSLYWLS